MDRIIAVLLDLKLDAVPRIVAASSAPLPLRPLRSVGQDISDDLKTAGVTKAATYESNVSSSVSVLVVLPVHQGRKYARVVTFYEFFCDLQLPPQYLLIPELVNPV